MYFRDGLDTFAIVMTRRELTDRIRRLLAGIYDERETLAIAFAVAEKFFGFTRSQAIADPDATVAGFDSELFDGICRELTAEKPLQYVLGEAEFCGLTLRVAEGVLIPRPETEELVQWIAEDCTGGDNLRILDIGTGSGAIAIALARFLPAARIDAIDISQRAIDIAADNARRSAATVRFACVDVLAPQDIFMKALPGNTYDIAVSNPPYIPESERRSMRRNVTDYEPSCALFVPDDDPVLFYREIALKAAEILSPGGRLYFEIHESLSRQVCAELLAAGFVGIECRNDINDKPRMVKCIKRAE